MTLTLEKRLFTPTHIHLESKEPYQVLSAMSKMKHPVTRQWVPCVIYQNKTGDMYVRTEEDFVQHMKPIHPRG